MTCAMLCGPSSPATTPSGWSRRTDTAAQPRCAPPGRRRPSSAPHNAAYCPDSRVRYRDWTRCLLRDSTRGPLQVDIAHRRVWLWDGAEGKARCWHLIVRREVGSPTTVKYSLSNAAADTTPLQLARMQGQRYWVE